jgi:NarL family two-component system response regulator LiaR
METIRVLIADDHLFVRKGVRALLSYFDDIELVGEAGDGWEAVDLLRKNNPDVVLMDLKMPGLGGIEATSLITAEYPEACILLMTSFIYDEYLLPAIKAGAQGCVLKDTEPKGLVHSIRQANQGQLPLDPKIAQKILLEVSRSRIEMLALNDLTGRELEVLTLAAKGLENKQIANQLSIEDAAVQIHINNILAKQRLSYPVEPAFYTSREGMFALNVEQAQ